MTKILIKTVICTLALTFSSPVIAGPCDGCGADAQQQREERKQAIKKSRKAKEASKSNYEKYREKRDKEQAETLKEIKALYAARKISSAAMAALIGNTVEDSALYTEKEMNDAEKEVEAKHREHEERFSGSER